MKADLGRALAALADSMTGDLYSDHAMRILYATDASAYRELPLAVAIPKTVEDLSRLIDFAQAHKTSLIPRAAGTSLAGQVVGAGIVVDISKHFTKIIEINPEEKWVKVQAGVIRDELNMALKPYNLYFGPETSTANRAMIGGMVGNNSCGSNSLIYGSAREHAVEIEALLSDGSTVLFEPLTFDQFCAKCELSTLEGELYRHMRKTLSNYENQEEIRREFPKASIPRRNTGYAIDLLLETDPFTAGVGMFNFAKLICGSEGTLAFITSVKLQLSDLFQKETGLLCAHFDSLDDALRANLIALRYAPRVSELMDHYILERTKSNMEQARNRFFVQGDPAAILVIEYAGDDAEDVLRHCKVVEEAMRTEGFGYHFPVVLGDDRKKVWSLRKAGLGLLSNTVGDEKPVSVIEDTAVDVNDLPEYIKEFNEILDRYGLYSVHYAHAATGELHLRPIINLKTKVGLAEFRSIAFEIAKLVKKFRGSLSGEHGDGRLRGEFIELMIGTHNYQLIREIKETWDPNNIFNPGKIVDTPPMDTSLRYEADQPAKVIPSVFRYNGQNILQHAEQCNGSGDCRKTQASGGTMCPSYMATRNEQDTTRARANMLREVLTQSTKVNAYDSEEIKQVMDLCLSCKACKSECPSGVDMSKLKADFMQGYYDANGVPLRSWMIGHVDRMMRMAVPMAPLYNWVVSNSWTSRTMKRMLGFAVERELPKVASQTLKAWFDKRALKSSAERKVYFFFDEFTNYNEVELGKTAILLLEKLGYQVLSLAHEPSGRALVSKGFLREAKELANANVTKFCQFAEADAPFLVGIEPSAILMFRDEYPDLVDEDLVAAANDLAKKALTIEEFLQREALNGSISSVNFETGDKDIMLHGHCQQKAWGLQGVVADLLRLPQNYTVEIIPSGCCGMAGSFGMEKEHYAVSQQVGELVLFPAIRAKREGAVVVASGTSCRHQIMEGVSERAFHPVEVLYAALR